MPLKRSLIAQILHACCTVEGYRATCCREGCVNTIATLLGELQRAAKTPAEVAEIVAARTLDLSPQSLPERTASQIDFDNEVALIYSIYSDLLNTNQLTEDDADQLRALAVLRGEIAGSVATLPWLSEIKLLVLDGFFDFTPVQGEMLRQLIPRVPETLVNLNHDDRNPEIFAPFQETVGQLCAISPFEAEQASNQVLTKGALSHLREKLFNPTQAPTPVAEPAESEAQPEKRQSEIRYLECGDRDTEIRTIAREIKRLVLTEDYKLSDIALIVRQRTSYAPTISRCMREESLACNLELRVEAIEVPAIRAVLKLLALLEELGSGETQFPRIRNSRI
jgi:ATP-dependent helicase/DNAse subunit B